MTELTHLRDGAASSLGARLLREASHERAPERTRYHVHAALGVGLAGSAGLSSLGGAGLGGAAQGGGLAYGLQGAGLQGAGAASASLASLSAPPPALGVLAGQAAVGVASEGTALTSGLGVPGAVGAGKASVAASSLLGWAGVGVAGVWLKAGLVVSAALGSAYIGYSAAGPLRSVLSPTGPSAVGPESAARSAQEVSGAIKVADGSRPESGGPSGPASSTGSASRVAVQDSRPSAAETSISDSASRVTPSGPAGDASGDEAVGRRGVGCIGGACKGEPQQVGDGSPAGRVASVESAVLQVSDLARASDEPSPAQRQHRASAALAQATRRALAKRAAEREAEALAERASQEAAALEREREGIRSQHLAEELRILGQVRARLAVGDKSGARRLLKVYGRRFPDGVLGPEAGLLTSKAQ